MFRNLEKRSFNLYKSVLTKKNFQSTQQQVEKNVAAQSGPMSTTPNVSLAKWQKYLVKWYGRVNYKSVDDVPNSISINTLIYAKDRARARMSIVLIGLTIAGAFVVSMVAKRDREAGHHRTDSTMQERMSYSKTHQELAANKFKTEH